jgi:hypothetical protein
MSWATILSEEDEIVSQVQSQHSQTEEAIFHGLRTAYNHAMHLITVSCQIGDEKWIEAVHGLKKVADDCYTNIEKFQASKTHLLDILYLANKNRLDCLSRETQTDSSKQLCFQLSLETVAIMLDLEKSDFPLILKTAKYALRNGDIWTYKQLMLLHKSVWPYLYRDQVMREFESEMQRDCIGPSSVSFLSTLERSAGLAASDHSAEEQDAVVLDPLFADAFVSFLCQHIIRNNKLPFESSNRAVLKKWMLRVQGAVSSEELSALPISTTTCDIICGGGGDNGDKDNMPIGDATVVTVQGSDSAGVAADKARGTNPQRSDAGAEEGEGGAEEGGGLLAQVQVQAPKEVPTTGGRRSSRATAGIAAVPFTDSLPGLEVTWEDPVSDNVSTVAEIKVRVCIAMVR